MARVAAVSVLRAPPSARTTMLADALVPLDGIHWMRRKVKEEFLLNKRFPRPLRWPVAGPPPTLLRRRALTVSPTPAGAEPHLPLSSSSPVPMVHVAGFHHHHHPSRGISGVRWRFGWDEEGGY
ncbi:hypothetical protein [Oryza sativa Japonica Group]|uniref:Uncharacterized protein n=1 Tax=Oryza sativa subsp. japonica TaxID=39947 RepID=Q9FU03_ORYSJ|nr:hypothetical protein [Oryza sativa Japonica Group]BAB55465.1 hypothetical protein [Oryza sativa Japonica Group]